MLSDLSHDNGQILVIPLSFNGSDMGILDPSRVFFGVLGPTCPRFPTALSEPEAQQFGGEPSRGSGVLIRLGQQLQRLFTQQMFEEQPESQAQFAQSEMIRDDQR